MKLHDAFCSSRLHHVLSKFSAGPLPNLVVSRVTYAPPRSLASRGRGDLRLPDELYLSYLGSGVILGQRGLFGTYAYFLHTCAYNAHTRVYSKKIGKRVVCTCVCEVYKIAPRSTPVYTKCLRYTSRYTKEYT